MNGYVCIQLSTLHTHLSAVVAGGAGLLGVVGDGCSCFSMVSFTSSCSHKHTQAASVPPPIATQQKVTLSTTFSITSQEFTFTPSSTALMTLVTDATFSLSSKSMPSSITWSAQRIRLARLWYTRLWQEDSAELLKGCENRVGLE